MMMMGFNLGALTRTIGAEAGDLAKTGIIKACKPIEETLNFAQHGFGHRIDIQKTSQGLEHLSTFADGAGAIPHLGTVTGMDILEGATTPSIASLAPYAINNLHLVKDLGLDGYVDLLKATTPNPLSAVRDATQSIFTRISPNNGLA